MKQILDYVLIDQSKSSDKKVKFKFPKIAASALSHFSNHTNEFFQIKIKDRLINFERLFERFLQNFSNDLNYTRTGYI